MVSLEDQQERKRKGDEEEDKEEGEEGEKKKGEEEEEQVSGTASNRWPSWPPQLLWFSFTRLPPGSRNRLEILFNQFLTTDSFFVSHFWFTLFKTKLTYRVSKKKVTSKIHL